MHIENFDKYIDVIHSVGAPLGGIGTGYFVYGKYGFTHFNLNGFPEQKQTADYPHTTLWDYTTDKPEAAPIALYAEIEGNRYYLQETVPDFAEGAASKCSESKAYMPFVFSSFDTNERVRINMLMYSSVKPHDLKNSSVPACVIKFEAVNGSDSVKSVKFGLDYNHKAFGEESFENGLTLTDRDGSISFICPKSSFEIAPKGKEYGIAAIGWFYKTFVTQGLARDDIILRHNAVDNYVREDNQNGYDRYYILSYNSSFEAANAAAENYDEWQTKIENWHNSFDLPFYIQRVLFGSFSSAITSSLLTANGYFFEIEQPHGCLNTMDVSVYSTWMYMINWPELEEKDLYQYINCIPMTGTNRGKVWHSLWQDGAHYVEEAIYAVRVWRYALWSGDRQFAADAFPTVKAALEYLYSTDGYGNLINNPSGNQSYDAWKMPGIDAYINTQWVYALFSFVSLCELLGIEPELSDKNAKELLKSAIKEFKEILWDEKQGYFKAYVPNEKSNYLPFGDAVFSDQLFGLWAVNIDKNAKNVIEKEFNERALKKIYTHNRLTDKKNGLSCWVNGMMPVKEDTYKIHRDEGEYEECGYHALSCWVSTQMELASLCYRVGLEEMGEDIFKSVSDYMGNNVLAVGEYNRSLGENFEPVTLRYEPGKDTPRFPAYPRYKSSWEHIISLLNTEADFESIYFDPAKNADITLKNVIIGNQKFNIRISKNWSECFVDGKLSEAIIPRDGKERSIEFK